MISSLKKSKNLLFVSLLLLTVINIIQGFSTELIPDEAYYWVYSQFMDWGYFDHPPMVAVWVTISNFFFGNTEIGVRFFSAFTLSTTIYLIWCLLEHPKKKEYTWLFLLIVLSTALFNVYGFVTVPDTPLIFFMALFLFGYKKYLDKKSTLSYIILAVSMAGMLYSKYQAVLIIGFVLLSNLKVLKDYKIWITALGTLLLFAPHLFWQFENDFPSIKYHLYERTSGKKYRVNYTIMHFVNQIAIIGLTFPIVYLAFYNNLKNKDLFSKALNFTVIGFIAFFFVMSFKGPTQAQWTLPISIPLIIITFYFLINNAKQKKLFTKLAFINIGVFIIARIILANDILPIQLEFHGNKEWVANLEQKLLERNKNPLFLNSYQNTSTYWFYSGKRPCQYNSWSSRKNQYDLFNYNKNCVENSMIQVGGRSKNLPIDSVKRRNKSYTKLFDVNGFNKCLGLHLHTNKKVIIKDNSNNTIPLEIINSDKDLDINTITYFVVFINTKKEVVKIADEVETPAQLIGNSLKFYLPKVTKNLELQYLKIVGKTAKKSYTIKLSDIIEYEFIRSKQP